MAQRRTQVVRYRISKGLQLLVLGLQLSRSVCQFLVESANLILATLPVCDVVVRFHDGRRLALFAAPQRPSARNYHFSSIGLGVLELALPASGPQQHRADVL